MVYIATKKNDYVIVHSGTKGMKWGVRKYQNEDGTLTAAGKERYLHNGIKLGSSIQANYEKDKSTDAKARAFQMKFTQYFKDKGINKSNARTYDYNKDLINDYMGWMQSNDNLLKAWMQSRIDSYIKSKATNGSRLLENQVYNNFNEFSDQDYYRLQGDLEEERREDTEKYGKEVAQHIYDIQNQYLKEYQKKHNTHTHGVMENASSGMPTSAILAKSNTEKAENEAKIKKNIPASAWNQRSSAVKTSPTIKSSEPKELTRREKRDPTKTRWAFDNQTNTMNWVRFGPTKK